ncbi:MAG TPA: glycine dehydrogenase (aminomethyl-transferring), partial [Flavobacteriia bacterium]|nr:glycine dehydrogenase (aminomethyl-transferring) [Flavobacteriia bacterium]
MQTDSFKERHLGPRQNDLNEMLDVIGVSSLEQLINETIPDDIRLDKDLDLPVPMSEYQFTNHINALGAKNKVFKTYIGLGYNAAILPAVIQRNIFENPSWYTSYTPYQAEISQGRLEALLNFQTMVTDLTGFDLANASLLDESTAAAEAMIMLFHARNRTQKKENICKIFVSDFVLPQTKAVMQTRAEPLGIELIFGDHKTVNLKENFFGAIVQYPGKNGEVLDYTSFIEQAHNQDVKVVVAADLLSLAMLKSPARM